MDLRDWLIAASIVLVLVIALDGVRRMRNRSKLRLKIDKEFENFPDIDYSAELPSGGARAVSRNPETQLSVNEEEVDLLMDDSFQGVSRGVSKKAGIKAGQSAPDKPASVLFAKATSHFKYQQQPKPDAQPTKKPVADEGERIEPSFANDDIDLLNVVTETSSQETSVDKDELLSPAVTTAEMDDADLETTAEASRFRNSDDETLGPVRVRTVVSASKSQAEHSESVLSVVNASPETQDDYDFNKPITELMGDRIPGAPTVELEKDQPVDDTLSNTGETREQEQPVEKDEGAPLVAEPRHIDQEAKSKPKKKAKQKKSSRIQRWKEEIQTSFFDIDPGLDPIQQKEQDDEVVQKVEKPAASSKPKPTESSAEAAESQVLALSVTAREQFKGVSLFKLVEACGMEFGEMDIFHRFEDDKGTGAIQFSMVNGVKPGHFDLAQRDTFVTPAVSFFLQMGEPADLMNAFECMLATAQCVADNLKGEVKDENHSVMRPQTIEHYRQKIRDFERRRLTRRA